MTDGKVAASFSIYYTDAANDSSDDYSYHRYQGGFFTLGEVFEFFEKLRKLDGLNNFEIISEYDGRDDILLFDYNDRNTTYEQIRCGRSIKGPNDRKEV